MLKDQPAPRSIFFWQVSWFESNRTGYLMPFTWACLNLPLQLTIAALKCMKHFTILIPVFHRCFTWLRSSSEPCCHEMANVTLDRYKSSEDNCVPLMSLGILQDNTEFSSVFRILSCEVSCVSQNGMKMNSICYFALNSSGSTSP